MRFVRPMSFFPTPKMSLTFCLFWLYFGSSLLTFTPLCLPSRVTNEKLCLMSIIHNRAEGDLEKEVSFLSSANTALYHH